MSKLSRSTNSPLHWLAMGCASLVLLGSLCGCIVDAGGGRDHWHGWHEYR